MGKGFAAGDVVDVTGVFPFSHGSELHETHVGKPHITEETDAPGDRTGTVGIKLKGDLLGQHLVKSRRIEGKISAGIFFDIFHQSICGNDVILLLNGEFGTAECRFIFHLPAVGKETEVIDPHG